VILDHRACHLGEAASEACGLFVPAFLRERRPPADVGDQERPDLDVLGALGSAGNWPIVIGHGASMRS
jgi:hypothetical protein